MTTITIQLQDEKATRVRQAANQMGVSIEEFLEKSLDVALSRNDSVQFAFDYVLKKNAELYLRLAALFQRQHSRIQDDRANV
jgi:hypothetical protein